MKKILLLVLVFFVALFTGYENPNLVDVPKKYIKFLLKRMNYIDNFVVEKETIKLIEKEKYLDVDNNELVIEGNSFNLSLKKRANFDERTAGFFIKNSNNSEIEFDIFLQNGITIDNSSTKEIYLPQDIFFGKNGGVKAVFEVNKKKFAYVSNKKLNCFYASIYEIEKKKMRVKTKCLPDANNIDFNGLGGAFVEKADQIYLSIGAPEWDSKEIRSLAQKKGFLYGKIIRISKNDLLSDDAEILQPEIFTLGHKNPQGLIIEDEIFFSIEHGPQGGDEINLIKINKNYGWPIVSYGTEYNNGKSFKKSESKYQKPLFSFLPSIAPSSLDTCPKNLKNYYKDDICLMFLTLRDMSLYVVLIDKLKLNVISYEKFKIEQRLRHFGKKNNKRYEQNSTFFISADGEGIYSAQFNNFR